MAKQLSKQDIATRKVVKSWHVSQSVDAFTGIEAYDIIISGSLTVTGSVAFNGLTDAPQSNILTVDPITGQVYYTSSSAIAENIDPNAFVTTSSFNNFTSSYNTGSFTGSFVGDGSQLTGTPNFANTDLTFDAGRSHEINGNFLYISNNYDIPLNRYSYFLIDNFGRVQQGVIDGYNGADMKLEINPYEFFIQSSSKRFFEINNSTNGIKPDTTIFNNNLHSFTGSINISGSVFFETLTDTAQSNILTIDTLTGQLYYTASNAISGGGTSNTGSFTGSFTGSLEGTASWAQNSLTASYFSGSVSNAISSSYALTSSYAATSSYVDLVAGPNITINQVGTSFQISSSGGGGGGYTTVENEGSPLIQRTTINFVGAGVTATDDGTKTVVTITGASGSLAAAGNNYEIQYNSGSELAATGSFKFNYLSESLELGGAVTALGRYSFAQGSGSQAIGIGSHAEGLGCISNGTDLGAGPDFIGWSHAEGAGTIASGSFSHTEGLYTLTLGLSDHAEGYQTTASSGNGDIEDGQVAAHAEGYNTRALYGSSHAEGYNTTALSGSHAEGFGTLAIGYGSHAEGWLTTASKTTDLGALSGGTHAEGYQTFASSSFSHAEGFKTISKGLFSHAEGSGSISLGIYSHAEGSNTLSLGSGSHTEGIGTTSSGAWSHAEGVLCISSGSYSHAQGFASISIGNASFASGYSSSAISDYSIALGAYVQTTQSNGLISIGVGTKADNSVTTAMGSYNSTGSNNSYAAFVVGGGSNNSSRSNLFRVSSSGECLAAGGFTNSGADYAEYFESHDGQPIPVGTVVELTGSLIKICENPDNAIGVISNKPSILGNSDEGTGDEWVGKYEKDIWGNYVMEEYKFELPGDIDENFNIIPKTITKTRKKLNPNFDPTLQYIPRSERPEWNVVGLLGQIKVLKNQQIPTRWIKMKDISDEIALYLVK